MSLSALSGAPSLASGPRSKPAPASSFDDDFESVLGGGASSSKPAKKAKSKKSVKFTQDDDSGEFGGGRTASKNPYLDEDEPAEDKGRHTGGGYLGSGGVLKTATTRRSGGGMVLPKGGSGSGDVLDALSSHTVGIKRVMSKEGALRGWCSVCRSVFLN